MKTDFPPILLWTDDLLPSSYVTDTGLNTVDHICQYSNRVANRIQKSVGQVCYVMNYKL